MFVILKGLGICYTKRADVCQTQVMNVYLNTSEDYILMFI